MGPPAGSPGRPLSTAPLAHRCPPLPVAACLLLRDYHCLTLLATATHHCLSPTTAEPTARSQRTRPTGPPPVPGHLLDPGIRPHRSPHPAISPCTWRRRRHRRRTFRMRTASSQRRRRPDTSRSPRIAVLTTKVRPQSPSSPPARALSSTWAGMPPHPPMLDGAEACRRRHPRPGTQPGPAHLVVGGTR